MSSFEGTKKGTQKENRRFGGGGPLKTPHTHTSIASCSLVNITPPQRPRPNCASLGPSFAFQLNFRGCHMPFFSLLLWPFTGTQETWVRKEARFQFKLPPEPLKAQVHGLRALGLDRKQQVASSFWFSATTKAMHPQEATQPCPISPNQISSPGWLAHAIPQTPEDACTPPPPGPKKNKQTKIRSHPPRRANGPPGNGGASPFAFFATKGMPALRPGSQ